MMSINLDIRIIIAALVLVLLGLFCGYKWYESDQKLNAEKSKAEHNDKAYNDKLRQYGNFTVKLAFEKDVNDSLRTENLKKENAIISMNKKIIELQNIPPHNVYVTDTLYTDSSAHKTFTETYYNGLVTFKDSVAVKVRPINSDTSKPKQYEWLWANEQSLTFNRQIELTEYLTQNSAGQYSYYVKTTNPADTAFLKIKDMTTVVNLAAVNKRTFWQKLYMAPGLGFDMVSKKLLYGIMLYQEDWQAGIGYQNNGNINVISLTYFTSLYNLFNK